MPKDIEPAVQQLAPSGRIRAAINLGNSALARGTSAAPTGISVDIAHELAQRADLPLDLVCYANARGINEGLRESAWDVAFMAVEPSRARDVIFTSPYMFIDGVYLVPSQSPFRVPTDVDRPGSRIVTTKGTAYALFLERNLKSAQVVVEDDGLKSFAAKEVYDAVAGLKQQLAPYAQKNPATRLLDEPFMEIPQALATPFGRIIAAEYVSSVIEDLKASGFITRSLARHGQGEEIRTAGPLTVKNM